MSPNNSARVSKVHFCFAQPVARGAVSSSLQLTRANNFADPRRFMMADQLRYDTQGAVWKGANTPNLDALGASGARFMKQFSSTPTCTPARYPISCCHCCAALLSRVCRSSASVFGWFCAHF